MAYYVIEGQDATGKTTQVRRLVEYLQEQGRMVLPIGEPEGPILDSDWLSRDAVTELLVELPQLLEVRERLSVIRTLVKDAQYQWGTRMQVALFSGARAEIAEQVIAPALEKNIDVVSSRNWFSTLAYQYRDGLTLRDLEQLTRIMTPLDYLNPDGIAVMILAEEERLHRQLQRGEDMRGDAFESRSGAYQARVNKNYEEIARGRGVQMIDASGTEEEIHLKIRKAMGL